jgi:hypothetical protein
MIIKMCASNEKSAGKQVKQKVTGDNLSSAEEYKTEIRNQSQISSI